MASPSVMGNIGIGASGAGSLLSAFGALQGGQAQQQMFNYQAGVANLNSQLALQNRDLALATGETEEEKYGMGAAQRAGSIRAGEGASGIDLGSGSKAAVQSSQQLVSDIDLSTIHNNAAQKAYNFQVQSTEDVAQAGAYTAAGSNAAEAGQIKALGSLVSGAGSVASKWTQGQSVGLNSSGNGLPSYNPSNSSYYTS